jgi:hypothetical protein
MQSRDSEVIRALWPYALWPHATPTGEAQAAPVLGAAATQALQQARIEPLAVHDHPATPRPDMPHEALCARALGWPEGPGYWPWAALAAVEAGLAKWGDGSAWAWVTLCHWQVVQGEAQILDPSWLGVDAATDERLRADMQGYFQEDGIELFAWRPGVWLARSPAWAEVSTASLDRVLAETVRVWQPGGDHPEGAARLWRRLQNEMQMLLYTHAVNAQRQWALNSLCLHGAGAMPAHPPAADGLALWRRLQAQAQEAHWQQLAQAWRRADYAAWQQAWAVCWQAETTQWPQAQPAAPWRLTLTGAHLARTCVWPHGQGWRRWWPGNRPDPRRVLREEIPSCD